MQAPYGEIPERFVKDMAAQEMHDYLCQRYSRRQVVKGAAAAAANPVPGWLLPPEVANGSLVAPAVP